MTVPELLRDAAARACAISEAIELGDTAYAHALALDLEHDLANSAHRLDEHDRGEAP